jgi:hypothetical protein
MIDEFGFSAENDLSPTIPTSSFRRWTTEIELSLPRDRHTLAAGLGDRMR